MIAFKMRNSIIIIIIMFIWFHYVYPLAAGFIERIVRKGVIDKGHGSLQTDWQTDHLTVMLSLYIFETVICNSTQLLSSKFVYSKLMTFRIPDQLHWLSWTNHMFTTGGTTGGIYPPTTATRGYMRGTCCVTNRCIGNIWNLFWHRLLSARRRILKCQQCWGYKVKKFSLAPLAK
jgi:hypothetical protein